LRSDGAQQPVGIVLAMTLRDAQNIVAVRVPDKVWVERLTVAGDAGDLVQVIFKQIRPSAHFRENDE
jgi:hypothetical protein